MFHHVQTIVHKPSLTKPNAFQPLPLEHLHLRREAKKSQTTNGHRRQSGTKRKAYSQSVKLCKIVMSKLKNGGRLVQSGWNHAMPLCYVYTHSEKITEGTHFPRPRPIPDLRLPSVHLDSPHLKLEGEAAKHSQSMRMILLTDKSCTYQN